MLIPASSDTVAALEADLYRMAPWMHPYRIGDSATVGLFKYHGLTDTVTTASSPAEAQRMHRAAFDDYLAGDPFFLLDEAVRRLGGVDGASVLDIACATGRFSFRAESYGGRVVGVEIRPEQVAQAELIGSLLGSGVSYRQEPSSADAAGYLDGEEYDFVLSLGLLYHLADPVQHLKNLARLARRAVLIHTLTHWGQPGMWQLMFEDPTWITKATSGQGWVPHFGAVPELLRRLGFPKVETIVHPLCAPYQEPLLAAAGSRRIRRGITTEITTRRFHRALGELLPSCQNPGYFTYLARR